MVPLPAPIRRPITPVDPELEDAASRALDHARGKSANRFAPPRAGAVAARILGPLLPKTLSMSLDELKRRWPDIVGEKLGQMTAPEKLTAGKAGRALTIVAAGPAAPFVQHQVPLILERCNLAGADLAHIQIRQGAVRRPQLDNVRRLSTPLAADEEQRLLDSVARIENEPLRAALLRLGRGVRP